MTDRLSSLDVSFFYLEGPTTPMHVGGLAVFDVPEGGFDHGRFVELISDRIALVPRYRQKIKWVPAHLGNPVWVDDADFDVSFHVRRSALPRPGSDDQLRELLARLQSRPLDRRRPLWEMNVVEGLSGNRFAVITKTHHAMVDGVAAVDLAQVILDPSATARPVGPSSWTPRREPSSAELVADALGDLLRRPGTVLDTLRMGANDARASAERLSGVLEGLVSAGRVAVRSAPSSPLNATIGPHRRFAVARTPLEDYRAVRGQVDGTVNDVVLATVAGALRRWLVARREPVVASTTVRALVPLSVRVGPAGELGNRVSSYLIDLPVGEPSPLMRLTRISYAMTAHKESGQSVGADALIALAGFAPPTLHALGARTANSFTRRLFNVVVTNVPGPQTELFAAGARMRELFPVVPLALGQTVSIGLTSYNGGVYYGLNADRDAMADVDMLAQMLEESLAELVAAIPRPDGGPRSSARSTNHAEGRSVNHNASRSARRSATSSARNRGSAEDRGPARQSNA